MDTRGAEKRVAELLLEEPYVGNVEDGRFHGFGRVVLQGGEEYAGEFQHGRRHGHGTAVWPDGLKYVGQWQNNAATGLGCLSWPSGCLYVGEVRRGCRHGMGVFRSGDCKYVGHWHEGRRHGWGAHITKEYTYSGQWVDGHRHGWGSCEFASLNRYAGEWEADRIHGRGTMLWVTLRRTQDAEDAEAMYRRSQRDLLAGLRAKLRNVGSIMPGPLGPFTPAVAASTDTLEQYTGEWSDNRPHGRGEYKLMFRTGASHRDVPFEAINEFRGSFREGLRHGAGLQHFADGTTFDGVWVRNLKHGPGSIYHPDGTHETVVMANDCPAETGQPRGGHGVMSLVKVDDLFDGQSEEDAADLRKRLDAAVSRASNGLRHLFNVYSAVACPVEFEESVVQRPPAFDVPSPDTTGFLEVDEVRVPRNANPAERNARIAAAIASKVFAQATGAARRAFAVLRECEERFDMAVQNVDVLFASPNATRSSAPEEGTVSGFNATASPGGFNATSSPGRTISGRRPATPQVDGDTTLESMLPAPLTGAQTRATEIRMTVGRLHALLADAQLTDAHFPLTRVAEVLRPLRQRLDAKPVREAALSFPSFVEAIIRICDARIGSSYPFFAADITSRTDLCGRFEYVVHEFLRPLCLALRDLDACPEFVKLGVDRYVFEASENSTVEEIRKAAIRSWRDKARLSKMKERSSTDDADREATLSIAATAMDTTVRLGETLAALTNTFLTPDALTMRRIDRPTSASVDQLDTMDLPSGPTAEKINAVVKHKYILGARDAPAGLAATKGPLSPTTQIPGVAFDGHLEVWFVVVNIRHANVVHHRCHAVVVSVSADDARGLISVLPCAALHRLHLVLGAPVPSDVRHHLRGAEGLRDKPTWAVRLHAPVLAHHLTRFEPIARFIEARIHDVNALFLHCKRRLYHLVDGMQQLRLVGGIDAYEPHKGQTETKRALLPADILLRNLMYSVLGSAVDSTCSSVTSVDPCLVPPVYDPNILRAFLRKTPDLAAALQIVAIQDDKRREVRQLFRNLRTPVGESEWWTLAQSHEITLNEFIAALVQTAYYLALSPPWPTPADEGDKTPADDNLSFFETTSNHSATTTMTRRGQPPPAITSVAATGVLRALEQFASRWPELRTRQRRSEFITSAECINAMTPPLSPKAAATSVAPPKRQFDTSLFSVRSAAPPANSPRAAPPAAPVHPAVGKEGKGQAPPPPPALPASQACIHRKARLGNPLLPAGGLRDVPPVRTDKPLRVRPRTAHLL
jgi:hypothetical protein